MPVTQRLVDGEIRHILSGKVTRKVVIYDAESQPLGVLLKALLAIHKEEEVSNKDLITRNLCQVPESLAGAVVDPRITEEVVVHLELEELPKTTVKSLPKHLKPGLRENSVTSCLTFFLRRPMKRVY